MKNDAFRFTSIAILAALVLPLSLQAATETVDGITWTYTVSDSEASIYESEKSAAIPTSTSGAITIPSTLGGYPVTSIGNYAFRNCRGLLSVTIPDSVTSIGNHAFYNCWGLTSVTIPNSVTNIERYAFLYCSDLTSLTIPASVTSIGSFVHEGCDGLTSIIVEAGNPVYDSRGNCNAIIRTADNTLVAGCQNTTISDSVTSIGNSAFSEIATLTSVTIPNSVTNIGDFAFHDCFGLTSVTIPDSVTSIGFWAFRYCSGLTSVTIPNSVTSIGEGAFELCSSLKSMVIPTSVMSIGNNAFVRCSGLKHLYLPASFEGRTDDLGIPEGCIIHFGVTPSIPSLAAGATPSAVTNAIESAGFVDEARVTAAVGGNAANYRAFKTWAQGVAGGEAAVVMSGYAAVSWLLGAEALFANEPEIRIAALALAQGTGNREQGTGSAMTVTVVVKNGEEIARVDEKKVASMIETTGDLGDWNGAAKLTPSVTSATRNQDGTMTFTVIPDDGTATSAFLRIKAE